MSAGLTTPLHLAANLLALFAAAGLAAVVLSRPGQQRRTSDTTHAAERRARDGLPPNLAEWLVAGGAIALAAGHAIDGALLQGRDVLVGWLQAGGLVAIALGLSPRQLTVLRGHAILLPVVPLPAAAIGAVAGLVGGVRAVLGGSRAILVGVGLLAWGAARGLAAFTELAPHVLTIVGAVALSGWLWQVSARRLLTRLVTAFVVCLLAVVVLLAVVISTLGAGDLVTEELRNLRISGAEISGSISRDWPRQAIEAATILQHSPGTLATLVENRDAENLEELLARAFGAQDFLAVLSPQGRVLLSASLVAPLAEGSFLLSLPGAEPVDRLLDAEVESGGLMTVGGRIVAIGGIRVFPAGELRPEDPPQFIVVTGRIADDVWAAQAATQFPFDLVVEAGGRPTATSGPVAGVAASAVVDELGGREEAALTIGGRALFAGAEPILDPETGSELGRVVAVRSGEVLAQLQRDQARRLFLLALTGALLAGIVAAFVAGRLAAPIRRLTDVAVAVREGDLDARANIGGPDEVGELGRTFDEMTASLSAQSTQLRDSAEVQSRLRARLEAMNASMSDALISVDTDGKVVTFNPAAERLVGRDVAEVIGLPLEEVLHGQGPDDEPVTEVLGDPAGEEATAVQLVLERSDGRQVPTAVTAAPVRDERDVVLGRVLVLRDVSREAEIERMKTEFLSNVSHELRTPLTPIKGYAEVLARRDVGPKATQQFASQILASTSQLERIVGMIVDFAALDSGRMRPRLAPTPVTELVGDAVARWRQRHPEREFRRRVARSLPPVLVDSQMVHRALDELMDNAVKFSPGGEPVSLTATLVETDDSPMVSLSVRDRGVGLEVDAVAAVFGDFYQVDASETRHFGGLGLGLALVRRIIDTLGGDATVEAEPGRGSTFHLLLPCAEVPDSAVVGRGRSA